MCSESMKAGQTVMESNRTTRECAEILFGMLRQGKALGYKEAMATGLLNREEFARGRKSLSGAGLICRSQATLNSPSHDACYELTGKPLPPARRHKPRPVVAQPSFDGLMEAWRIRLPRKSSLGDQTRP